MKKSKFTLIELIVVIAVIGILAAIVIPNISNMQEKANQTALNSNIRNLQTAADMFSIEHNGGSIGVGTPDTLIPQSIDFAKINPDYVRNVSKVPNAKYWVDVNGQVWGSTADAPLEVKNADGVVSWKNAPSATGYQVFEVTENKKTGWTAYYLYKKLGTPLPAGTTSYTGEPTKKYAVSAIDDKQFLTAPVGLGGVGGYIGYEDTLTSGKDGHSGSTQPDAPLPTATIVMTPADNLKNNTTITWSYENKENVKNAEWKVDGVAVTNPPDTLSQGNHTIELRIQDQSGKWSDWTNKTVTVASSLPYDTSYGPSNFVAFGSIDSADNTGFKSYFANEGIEDSAGNIITIGGTTYRSTLVSSNTDAILAKHDSKFNALKRISLDFTPEQIINSKDGNYVVIGNKTVDEIKIGVVAKYDTSLNLIKSITFGNTAPSNGYTDFKNIATDSLGNFYAVGGNTTADLTALYPGKGATKYGGTDYYSVVVKFDENLNVLRINNNISKSTIGLGMLDVLVDDLDNIYITGGGYPGTVGIKPYIGKLDSALNVVKSRYQDESWFKEMVLDKATGNIIVFDNQSYGSKNLILYEYDKNLEIVSSKTFSPFVGNSITQLNDGSLLLGAKDGYYKFDRSGTDWTYKNYNSITYRGPLKGDYTASADNQSFNYGTITSMFPTKDGGTVYLNSSLGKIGGEQVKSNLYILKTFDSAIEGGRISVKSTIPDGAEIKVGIATANRNYASFFTLLKGKETASSSTFNYSSSFKYTPYFYLIPNDKGEYPTLDSFTVTK